MYEKILVPLDGSKTAEMVVPYAEELAAKLGSELILASVSEPVPTDTEPLYRAYLERFTEQVQYQLKDWKPMKETKVQSKVLMGRPADEILRYADETNAGLIAMTSRGSSVRSHWLLGNIVAQVLRTTGRPLLLVRTPAKEAALKQKRLVKRILVPLDGSELGAAAIPYAEVLSKALGAELVLFHGVEPELGRYDAYGPNLPAQEQHSVKAKADATVYLESRAKLAKQKGLSVSIAVDFGSPADRIIEYAKMNSIDLIAISTHGRTGIGRWVFGSVTEKVLQVGDTAVLVIRASKT